jgi:hypothetical protein
MMERRRWGRSAILPGKRGLDRARAKRKAELLVRLPGEPRQRKDTPLPHPTQWRSET